MIDLDELGKRARAAAATMAGVSRQHKCQALLSLAAMLEEKTEFLLDANQKDILGAGEVGLSPALIDRLRLSAASLSAMADDLRSVSALDDPVGKVFDEKVLPNGLRVHKQRVPIGVLAVIYESRPNVTIDVASLALKSGNAVILRGGKETLHSNRALVTMIHEAMRGSSLPVDAVQFIDSDDRALVLDLLQRHQDIDMLIPRGGKGLHQFCRENSRIPVITGGIGICHLFVDESADCEVAIRIIHNAKTQRPSVCNALDTVLIHKNIAETLLPPLMASLQEGGVSFRLCPKALPIAAARKQSSASWEAAGPQDFDTEWLSLVLGIRVVDSLEEAIEHIQQHSTGHSDGILTRDECHGDLFVKAVDSAAVYVNASTRFTDGGQLGLGAEVAISTQRLHARGPMALEELTTYKWVIRGDGHIRL